MDDVTSAQIGWQKRTCTCTWCGTESPATPSRYWACCQAPRSALGYLVMGAGVLVKNLAIPLAIGVMTLLLTDRQQESARALADHEKLVAAYVDFGHAHSDYRLASSEILFLALGAGPTVPSSALKGAVLKMDQAFDSIGGKLTPFEEYDRTSAHFTSPFADGKTALEETWQNCFIQPYFARSPGGSSHWDDITRQLALCQGDTCPISVAAGLKKVLEDIDRGSCSKAVPEKQRSFLWFWNELRRVMAENRMEG